MFTLREQSFRPPDEITQQARRVVLDNLNKQNTRNESLIDRVRHGSALFAKRRPQPSRPLTRTPSQDSFQSVYSMPTSMYSAATSVQSEPVQVPNLDYQDPLPRRETLKIGLSAALDHVSACADVGSQVFNELSVLLRKTHDGANKNSPEKLIDWNLNLLRVLLCVRTSSLPPEWRDRHVIVQVEERARATLTSELAKIRALKNAKFNKFLFNVAARTPTDDHLLQINALDDSPDKFQQALVDSDLFKEFNIDSQFKNLVAHVSIQNSRQFGSQFMAVALRNYFLNLLVAAQTLFEFYYSGQVGVDVDNLSSKDRKILWKSIRQRNFEKIKVFGECAPHAILHESMN
ncbi:hypothetical protein KL905_004477 [Ogataea polymorpha]|nr:hypothetical protein KL937_004150 [Ogataea polymorpha]KAG7887234.1 hypothetical protein KL936_004394 [Ogataea polymorpha]KAG7896571.1 hypothetical protein KL908_001085 [Ogataea polymorpha]KAG7916748.1 hypothetical protein KL905_004477 [Ogataea polymorpha]KAG7932673.1 hypothetical protein KL904_004464 [Ogataea polymorpha]